jgi:hypothetical protein
VVGIPSGLDRSLRSGNPLPLPPGRPQLGRYLGEYSPNPDAGDMAEDPCEVTRAHVEAFQAWMIEARSASTGCAGRAPRNPVAVDRRVGDRVVVPDVRLPVLWLCGPSGVGKSTVGWDLFAELPGGGYVDIDQLGMCYPTIPADPDRTVLEARILGRLVANFRASGAGCLVVSGYIDAQHGIPVEHLPDAALQVLRLRCDGPELARRLSVRARPGQVLPLELREAEILDHSGLPYPWLDTTGMTAVEVRAGVRQRWREQSCPSTGPWPAAVSTPGEVLWLCGASAVGKSTVGFEIARSLWEAGHVTGFVDLQQLGFLRSMTGRHRVEHRLRAANLAALRQYFHEYGADRVVVVGPVAGDGDLRWYTQALPGAAVTLYRLHASSHELRERIRRRGLGEGPGIAGDGLRGQPAAVLDRAHQVAVGQAEALERAGFGDVRVETDGRAVTDLVRQVMTRQGW